MVFSAVKLGSSSMYWEMSCSGLGGSHSVLSHCLRLCLVSALVLALGVGKVLVFGHYGLCSLFDLCFCLCKIVLLSQSWSWFEIVIVSASVLFWPDIGHGPRLVLVLILFTSLSWSFCWFWFQSCSGVDFALVFLVLEVPLRPRP